MSNTILTRTQISRVMAFTVAMIAAFNIVSMFQTNKAQAAWVNIKPFNQGVLNAYCNYLTNYGGLNKGAINYGGTVSDWYCVITPPSRILPQGNKIWITPGKACGYSYPSSPKFVTTNFNNKWGGYCAQWR